MEERKAKQHRQWNLFLQTFNQCHHVTLPWRSLGLHKWPKDTVVIVSESLLAGFKPTAF